ncbi:MULTISPECIES: hypothetical protein [Providencia]|uniref:Uncharacterized protein n=2 Tax=Providencia huaxiensis TaxID=2027290 RepID=A0A8I2AN84_9GAMM|nr:MULTISPECIES: hypothetical protein [Providencia]MBQ0268413.1 hypothetical protein [Providencia huaxiensis]
MKFEMIINYLIKFTVNCLVLLISINSFAGNRPGFVCGQFNKNIIEVPGEYVFPFAEYEGYSYFDPRFIENKKGCEANFRVLPMRMSWSDLKPSNEVSNDVKIIEVYAEPLKGNPEKYLSYRKHVYLDMGYLKRKGELYYDEELDLYFTEVTVTIRRSIGHKDDMYFNKKGYYWKEINNEVVFLIECEWLPIDEKYHKCFQYFLIPEIGTKVKFYFDAKELSNSNIMREKIRIFLLDHVKN